MFNAEHIWNKLTNHLGAKKAQVGVDLTIKHVRRIMGGYLPTDGKTVIATEAISLADPVEWVLEPGPYEVTFDQGLNTLGLDETAFIVMRSSLNRMGCMIKSGVFDPGFTTPNLGATMYVTVPVRIEAHARVAQLIMYENQPVAFEARYRGQFQGK